MAFNYRQLRFIDEFVLSLNATQAAIQAGYSPRTARAIGSENLRKFEIKVEIDRRLKEREAMPPDPKTVELIEQLKRVAFADWGGILEDGGEWQFKPIEKWPREAWDAIDSVRLSEKLGPPDGDGKRRRVKYVSMIKMKDRMPALRTLLELEGALPRVTKRRARRRRPSWDDDD